MKTCPKCSERKPVTEFYKHKTSKDGRHSHCKLCCKQQSREHLVKKREISNAKYSLRKTGRRYKPRKSDARKTPTLRHAIRALGYDPTSKPDASISLHKLYVRAKGICALCHRSIIPKQASLDHKIPLSKGGTHTWGNVQLAHLTCNLRKGTKI